MKKTAPAVIMALVIATLAVIGVSCSRNSAPAQSAFAAEHGQWYWLQSEGGLDNELVQVDSVDYFRYLSFTFLDTVRLEQVPKDTAKDTTSGTTGFEVGYTVRYETHNSDRVKTVHYDNVVNVAQIMEFVGRDTLILTDLSVYGYTHLYQRQQ